MGTAKAEEDRMTTSLSKIEFARIELGDNPRKDLGDVDKLAHSIKKEGLLQPLVVEAKKVGNANQYTLKAGFRRHEAIRRIREEDKKAFQEVPVVLWRGNDDDARFLQIAENVQRKDLNPIELADALREMINKGYKASDVSERVGLSTPWVQKLLKVREMCSAAVLKAVAKGEISVAAAYELVDCDKEKQEKELDKYKETKKTKGVKAAKRGATKGGGKNVVPGKRTLSKLLTVLDAHEDAFKSEYWQGVTDALNYSMGSNEDLIESVESEAKKYGIDLEGEGKSDQEEDDKE